MSTKTSFKRIALVAAASLGLGVLTSVAPASATTLATVTSVASATQSVAVGTAASTTISGSAVSGDTGGLTASVTVPSGSTVTLTERGNGAGTDIFSATGAVTYAGSAVNTGTGALTFTDPAATVTDKAFGTFTIVPDKAGVYVLTLTGNATTKTFTVYAGFGIDASNPTRAFPTQGNNTTTGWSTTAGGVGTVRLTNYPSTASVRHFVTVTGGTILTATVNGPGTSQHITKLAPTDNTAAVNLTNGSNFAGGVDFYVGTASTPSESVDIQVQAAATGNVTVTDAYFDTVTGSATVYTTAVLTVGSASASSPSQSSVNLSNVSATDTSSVSDILVSKTATGQQAWIRVSLKDQYGNPLTGKKLTVTLDGPGFIYVDQDLGSVGDTTAKRTYADPSANTGNTWEVAIAADGTAGKLNVTISDGTTVIGTKSLTFYGAATKYTTTTNLIATADNTATRDVVNVCAVDANGTTVPGERIYASSGDTSVAAVESDDTTATSSNLVNLGSNLLYTVVGYVSAKGIGCAGFTVTGVKQTVKDSAVLTFRNAYAAADATVSTTATIKVGTPTAAAVILTTDKDSYAAGAKATVTLTFKDATGRLVGANPGVGTLDATLVSSASLVGGTLFSADNNILNGVATADVYVPWNQGTVILTGKTGVISSQSNLDAAARGIGLTKSFKVTAAADSTSAQIASLISKINALSKLIAKIQKKLGIK